MAVIELHYHPSKLGISTGVSIVLPTNAKEEGKLKALYMLHGGGGCHDDLLWTTDVLDLAQQYHVAVIMPDGQNSCWADMAYGPTYEKFVTEGLREFVSTHFPVSGKREDSYLGGISMGGYGALHIGLHHPELFTAVCGMGSGVWLPQRYGKNEVTGIDESLQTAFGEERSKVIGSQYDCLQCAKDNISEKKQIPRLLSCAGKKDFSYNENVLFRDELRKLGIEIDWAEGDDGHEKKSWDLFMPMMFEWMFGGSQK